MSSLTNVLNSSDSENACVVCFKNVDVFSVGVCDHPVCFECSTRMRVLCNQFECPICRQEMPKVLFTKHVEPYHTLKPKVERQNLYERKYGLYFHSPSIQRRYYQLLDHECLICKLYGSSALYKTFPQLKDHMRRTHGLFYCDLCVTNLKIFTFERRCYTRVELATHRRKGDVDNTSHRGHPLCEFCETRFMDNDELFRHLRRDHLYCHFCDADGKHQYYSSYSDLRRHYSEEHYLCEEGDCKHETFTSVFRSDIDLKAHYASLHSKNLSKAATRQARTLELEFTLAPRARPEANRSGRNNHYKYSDRQEEEGAVGFDTYYLEPGGPGGGHNVLKVFNPFAAEEFPSLNGDTSNAAPRAMSNLTITSKLNPLSEDNFPTLGGNNSAPPRSSAVTITSYSKFNSSNGESATRQPAVSVTRGVPKINSVNYPALGESSATGSIKVNLNNNNQERSTINRPKSSMSIHVNHKTNGSVTTHITQSSNTPTVSVRPLTAEAFPALNSAPIPQAQWVSQKQKKSEPKPHKVAPAPSLPPTSLMDFPSLSKTGKAEPKKLSSTWVNLNNFNSDLKNNNANKQKLDKNKDNKSTKQEIKNSKAVDTISNESSKTKKKKNKATAQNVEELNDVDNYSNVDETAKEDNKSNNQNGIVKKRSELNIGALEVKEAITEDTASVSRPPPGFTVKPPPGFHHFPLPNNAVSNDLTFTNSSGQSYSIIPRQQFFHPPNFKIRNQILIETFKAVLNSDEIQHFKVYSDKFRLGEIPAKHYYEHCQKFMGSEFHKLFPELLVLLPDVEKQQELYKIHKSLVKTKALEVCGTCEQVVLKSDLRNHLSNHALDNHFPVLSQSVTTNNVWNKK